MSSYAALLDKHGAAIAALCRKYGVVRLEVFGSAADGTFVPGKSDHDFLVELDFDAPGSPAYRLVDLADDLEALLETHVDLVTPRSVDNPYFKAAMEQTLRPVYAG